MAEFAARFPDKIRRSAALCPEQTPPAPADAPPAGETARRADGKKEIDKEKSVEYIDLRTQLGLLSEAQLKIVSAIEKEPTHIDDIVEKTGLGAATVLTQLTVLTVKGIVRRLPGNRVALNVQRRS
jgi:predicted Rossmann fold nucleotide-binding protein DprA/Smf involved in DNA uptake